MIDWQTMDKKPRARSRVIAFSPKYADDKSMRFRIMREYSLGLFPDIQLWAYIDDPETDYTD